MKRPSRSEPAPGLANDRAALGRADIAVFQRPVRSEPLLQFLEDPIQIFLGNIVIELIPVVLQLVDELFHQTQALIRVAFERIPDDFVEVVGVEDVERETLKAVRRCQQVVVRSAIY